METAEPEVVTESVRRLLARAVRPDDPDAGETVIILSERAETSTRTIYRILAGRYAPTMNLDLADRLALAAGYHLTDCEIIEASAPVEYAV